MRGRYHEFTLKRLRSVLRDRGLSHSEYASSADKKVGIRSRTFAYPVKFRKKLFINGRSKKKQAGPYRPRPGRRTLKIWR